MTDAAYHVTLTLVFGVKTIVLTPVILSPGARGKTGAF
jgi:hypothetical protein